MENFSEAATLSWDIFDETRVIERNLENLLYIEKSIEIANSIYFVF